MTGTAVRGLGVLASCGLGAQVFRQALAGDGFRRDLGHASPRWASRRYGVCLVEDLERLAARELEGADLRRVDRVGVLALLAARDAVRAAGLEGPLGERTGLVLASAHGAIAFSSEYHEGAVQRGTAGLSALLFSSSLLSSAAGAVALALGIRGPVHTLNAGATAAADALRLAGLLLESGEVDRVLAVGAEMFHPVYLDAYDSLFRLHARFGRPPEPVRAFSFAEGATALVLDAAEEGGLGRVLGSSGTHLAQGWGVPLAPRLGEVWARAGLEPRDADLFLPNANHSFVDRLEAEALRAAGQTPQRVLALKPRAGEGFAHTALLQVAAGLLLLEPGQRALVQALHFDGAAGAVALGRDRA